MKTSNSVWSSVGLLIGAVIAILAIVRGKWQIPLLISVFSVWVLWIVYSQVLLPGQDGQHMKRRKKQSAGIDRTMAETVLRHVNYRISDCLKSVYPDVRWEWMMRDPALFVVQGGTGRIRVYGVPDYDFADITVDQGGKLSCSFITMTPVESVAEKPEPPNRQEQDPQEWYNAHTRGILNRLVTDLDSRGHNSLILNEDGSIVTYPSGEGIKAQQGTLPSFPPKSRWNTLASLMEQEGLTATVLDSCIAVTW